MASLGYTSWMTVTAPIQELAAESRSTPVFSGHESFPLRFTWLTKAVQAVARDPAVFAAEEAMVTLGVGKNMVRAMRHWALSAGVITQVPSPNKSRTPHHHPTDFGRALFSTKGWDQYMEDPATVWLIHWRLAANPRLGSWYWLFNQFRGVEFDKRQLVQELLRFCQASGDGELSEDTIGRDVDCLLRAYVQSDPDKRLSREELLDCPLTELGLVRRGGVADGYGIPRSRRDSLPDRILAFAIVEFWERVAPRSETLSFEHLSYTAAGPGQVFKISENALVEALVRLETVTGGAIRFGDTAGLRQLYRTRKLKAESLLHDHYSSSS